MGAGAGFMQLWGDIAGSGLNAFWSDAMNEASQSRQYDYTRKLMQQQNQFNRMMQQDQYKLQVGGMRAAGLSPAGANTALGGASSPSGPAAGAGQSFSPNVDFANDILQGLLYKDSHELNDANVEKTKEEAREAGARADAQEFENSEEQRGLRTHLGQSNVRRNDTASDLDEKRKEEVDANVEALTAKAGLDRENARAVQSTIDRNAAETAKLWKDADKSEAEAFLARQKAYTEKYVRANLHASSQKLLAEKTYTDELSATERLTRYSKDEFLRSEANKNRTDSVYQQRLADYQKNVNEILAAIPPEKRAELEAQGKIIELIEGSMRSMMYMGIGVSSAATPFGKGHDFGRGYDF